MCVSDKETTNNQLCVHSGKGTSNNGLCVHPGKRHQTTNYVCTQERDVKHITMCASGKETSNIQHYVYPGKRPSTNGTNYVILQLFYIYSTAYSPVKLVLNRNKMGKRTHRIKIRAKIKVDPPELFYLRSMFCRHSRGRSHRSIRPPPGLHKYRRPVINKLFYCTFAQC
jgi:hypothetical protein